MGDFKRVLFDFVFKIGENVLPKDILRSKKCIIMSRNRGVVEEIFKISWKCIKYISTGQRARGWWAYLSLIVSFNKVMKFTTTPTPIFLSLSVLIISDSVLSASGEFSCSASVSCELRARHGAQWQNASFSLFSRRCDATSKAALAHREILSLSSRFHALQNAQRASQPESARKMSRECVEELTFCGTELTSVRIWCAQSAFPRPRWCSCCNMYVCSLDLVQFEECHVSNNSMGNSTICKSTKYHNNL